MKKSFVLISVVFISLLFISASAYSKGEKMRDIKELDLGAKTKDIQFNGAVKTDLNFGKFSLYFIANKGQVKKKAKFYAKASRYTLWLTREGLVFDSTKRVEKTDTPRPLRGHPSQEGNKKFPHSFHSPYSTHSPKIERDVSRLIFLNANKNPGIVPVEESKLRVNYFIGNDPSKWHCDIPTSKAVLYKNLYKNIDLKVYGIEKQIEYDWIVKPGGNPGDIRFEYKNVKSTGIDSEGNLIIETDFGELVHKKPVSYQKCTAPRARRRAYSASVGAGLRACPIERKYINVMFKKIGKNIYGFEVGEYDKRYELIIDPVVLAYSTYLGGSGHDFGLRIAVEGSGNVYVTGKIWSTDYPTLNQYQTDQSGYDAFVTKIDTTQAGASSLIYSTYLGGGEDDRGYGIAVDGTGNVYVAGYTDSPDFPTLNQYQTYQGSHDTFITKIDTTQAGASSLIYSTYLGGGNNDYGTSIAVDNSGYTYVTGYTSSADFPTLNQYQTDQPDFDAFIAKIDTTRAGGESLIYSTYLGGDSGDMSNGITVDLNISGYVYVTGTTDSTNFPTLNQYQEHQICRDVFVTKIDTTQSGTPCLIYSTYLGGNYHDQGHGIAVDSIGNVYITGWTGSWDFPILNQYQAYPGYYDSWDAFVTKIDTTQSGTSCLVYSTYLGGDDYDEGMGITVDRIDNVYVTGYTLSTNFPTLDQYQTYQGNCDAFVTKINTARFGTSSLVYSTYLGGGRGDEGCGIAVDGSGNVYVTGITGSADFPTLNQYQTYQGLQDVFVTKLFYQSLPTVTTAPVTSITTNSAECGGEVISDGNAEVTTRGVCWSTSPNPTTDDNHTTDGTGIGIFHSSLTGLTPNTVYYVRAYATNAAGTAYGHEEICQTEKPRITVTSPHGGESWEVNTSQTITWTSEWLEGNVKIEYSTNKGGSWLEIIASTENDGSYPWTIPNTVSNQCLIRVSETDGRPKDISGVFSITAPGITVTSPNGGETWPVNSPQTITWTSTGTVGNVKIEYSINNGGNWTEIISATENDGSFPWTVPDTVSNQCLIRVSETDGSPTDTGNSVFAIVSSTSITVVYPNGGETFYIGSTEHITWTSSGNVGNVKIEYSTNNGDTWTEIIASTANDGSFPWTVPATPSDQCLVRVSETGGSPVDISNNVFSIVQKPTITITSPNGGESWEVGSNHTITWTSEGNIGNVLIECSIKEGASWRTIVQSTENDGTFNWKIPDLPADNCLIRISANDVDQGISDMSNEVFSIVPVLTASITVTSPIGGEQLAVGSIHEIKWTAAGTDQVPDVMIEYSTDRAATWTTIVPSMPNAANGSFNWTVPDTPSDNCLVRVTGLDVDGAPSDTSDEMFTILPLPSTAIIVTSPNGGETWQVDSQQTITWETVGSVNNVKIEYSANGGESWNEIIDAAPNSDSFDWNVSDTPSDNCLVRVSNSDTSGEPADVSDAVFSIVSPPSITVTAPNGGEQWEAGSSRVITWTSTGSVGGVTIDYSCNGGETWIIITGSEPNNGSYDWSVPDTPSENCLVRISANDTDPGEGLADVSDNEFSITGTQIPSLTVTSPNGGELLFVGTPHEIKWTSAGPVGNINIDYSFDGGESWTEITQSTENDGSHEWTVPEPPADDCLVRVSETGGQPLDISDAVFSIVSPSNATITLNSPNGGETWFGGSTYEIKWTNTGTINHVALKYSIDNSTTWTTIAASTANDGSFDWTVPETPSDDCRVRVSSVDQGWDGGPSDTSDWVFSIVSLPPVALRVVLPNGGETWEVGSTQEITWTSAGNINQVKIEYSTSNGDSWATIVESTDNNGMYNWTIPGTPADNCLVRISTVNTQSAEVESDVSDGVFSIVPPEIPTITVKTPNGGERLYVGYQYEITWTTTGTEEDVTIDYSTNGGESWAVIIGATPNDGSFEWTVPDELSESCLVRISETDGDPLDVSDAVFSIISPPSAFIEVITPNGGENLTGGSEYDITWTSTGFEYVIIEYSKENGGAWGFIASTSAADESYLWTIPDVSSDLCLVRITGNDSEDNPSDVSDAVFSITSTPSAFITVISPNGGENLSVGSTYEITWTSTGLEHVLIEYTTDNRSSWNTIEIVPASAGSYTWTVPGTQSDECLVRISGSDSSGDPSDVSDALFSITSN